MGGGWKRMRREREWEGKGEGGKAWERQEKGGKKRGRPDRGGGGMIGIGNERI